MIAMGHVDFFLASVLGEVCKVVKGRKLRHGCGGLGRRHTFASVLGGALCTRQRKNSEVHVAGKLEQFRAAEDGFIMTSFGTFAGAGVNGAIIDHARKDGDCAQVWRDEVLWLKCGSQYWETNVKWPPGFSPTAPSYHSNSPRSYRRPSWNPTHRAAKSA